ncbi:hypothetical protein [Agromyces mariniharenae]|uniref:YcxB family protein n=1 Tax=Agromyces mariniharenae TaxID=2604423 RepID=A0A5S4VFD8_9MICO|nr:hypothetical protein [Agromyces mariniharenae]TYL52755.1 hypothetical protein FYC51_03140 [Agromyces mariniharenae]
MSVGQDDEVVIMEHEFTADATTSDRLAAGSIRYVYTRPPVIATGVVICLAVALTAVLGISSWPGAGVGLALIAGIVWILISASRRRLARQLRSITAGGQRTAVRVGPDSLHVTTALSDGAIDYRAFESAAVSGSAVLLKTRNGSTYTVLPVELFPPTTLGFVRARIAAA